MLLPFPKHSCHLRNPNGFTLNLSQNINPLPWKFPTGDSLAKRNWWDTSDCWFFGHRLSVNWQKRHGPIGPYEKLERHFSMFSNWPVCGYQHWQSVPLQTAKNISPIKMPSISRSRKDLGSSKWKKFDINCSSKSSRPAIKNFFPSLTYLCILTKKKSPFPFL